VFVLAVMLGVETQLHIGALAMTGFGAKASARKQQRRVGSPPIVLKNPRIAAGRLGAEPEVTERATWSCPHPTGIGCGPGMSLASLRRFWAIAAR
jgi:hypothetical protein